MSSKWLYITARGRQDRETGYCRAPIEGRRVGPRKLNSKIIHETHHEMVYAGVKAERSKGRHLKGPLVWLRPSWSDSAVVRSSEAGGGGDDPW